MVLTGNVDAGDGDVRRKDGIGHETDLRKRTARLNESGAGLRIVDQVRALQVKSARAQVADFKRGLAAELLLERSAPLLDILRGRMQLQAVKLTTVVPSTGAGKLKRR